MLELGELYPPTWRGRPLAMLDPDVPVWHRFLDAHGADYPGFYYNVRLTQENLDERFPDPELRRLAGILKPKRIDAVAIADATTTLFEAAAVPGLRSIGQLLTYRSLWIRERPPDAPNLRLVLVCGACSRDEQLAAQDAGITVVEVAR